MKTENEKTQQHTPGPWTYVGAFNGSDFSIIQKGEEFVSNRIAVVPFDHAGIQEAQHPTKATANARLIAAAPDLLAQLQNLVRLIDGGSARNFINTEDAEAAIFMATASKPKLNDQTFNAFQFEDDVKKELKEIAHGLGGWKELREVIDQLEQNAKEAAGERYFSRDI